MQIDIRVEDNASEAIERVIRAGKHLSPVWTDFGERMLGSIGRTLRKQKLSKKGDLERSLTYRADEQSLTVGTNKVYAAIQHFGSAGLPGGVVRPTRRKFLTIPFEGVTRTAPSYANTFVIWKKKGVAGVDRGIGVIMQKTGKRKLKPLFTLVKQVRIPARPYMVVQEGDWRYLERSVGDYLAGAWEKE